MAKCTYCIYVVMGSLIECLYAFYHAASVPNSKGKCLKLVWANGDERVLIVGDFAESEQVMYLVMVSECQSAGKIGDSDIYRITMTSFINLKGIAGHQEDEKVAEVSLIRVHVEWKFGYTDLIDLISRYGKF